MTRVKPYICTMPLKMDEGWNQIQLNLADFTRRAYGTNYVETLRVQVHANCRLRRIYFSDRLYSEEELPPEFKLYLPMQVNIWVFDLSPHCSFLFLTGILLYHWLTCFSMSSFGRKPKIGTSLLPSKSWSPVLTMHRISVLLWLLNSRGDMSEYWICRYFIYGFPSRVNYVISYGLNFEYSDMPCFCSCWFVTWVQCTSLQSTSVSLP